MPRNIFRGVYISEAGIAIKLSQNGNRSGDGDSPPRSEKYA
jgi:hypothetical protein